MFEETIVSSPRTMPPLVLKKKERHVSLREYILWEAKRDEKYEYHVGKIVKMPSARGPHNEIAVNVMTAIKNAIRPLQQKYRVFSSDQKIYLPDVDYGVYPDAVAVSEAPQYWDDDTLLLINPLLVVEVLSKSTQKYDKEGKFALYKTLPTFQEYILIRQDAFEVETRFKVGPGLWQDNIVKALDASVALKSIGCAIAMEDIYEHIELQKIQEKK